MPPTHTAEGPLRVTIASITDVSTGNTVSIGRERQPVVRFIASPPLRVRILGIRYQQGIPPVAFVPSSLDFDLLVSWLGRAYPVGQVISSRTVIDATALPPFGCGDINAQLAAIRALDMSAGGDPTTHYYGLVSDGGFFMRGCAAGIPATADPSTVASGPTGRRHGAGTSMAPTATGTAVTSLATPSAVSIPASAGKPRMTCRTTRSRTGSWPIRPTVS